MWVIVLIQLDNLIQFYFLYFFFVFLVQCFVFVSICIALFSTCVSVLSLQLAHVLVSLHINKHMLNCIELYFWPIKLKFHVTKYSDVTLQRFNAGAESVEKPNFCCWVLCCLRALSCHLHSFSDAFIIGHFVVLSQEWKKNSFSDAFIIGHFVVVSQE